MKTEKDIGERTSSVIVKSRTTSCTAAAWAGSIRAVGGGPDVGAAGATPGLFIVNAARSYSRVQSTLEAFEASTALGWRQKGT